MQDLEDLKLFAVENHASTNVFKHNPWEDDAPTLPARINTKSKFEKWATNPNTKHVFFSGYEGVSNLTRISKNNPPHAMWALVIDYDVPCDKADLLKAVAKFEKAGFTIPNAMCLTKSGCARTVYVLEKPFELLSPRFTDQTLKKLKKKLRIESFLPGLDKNAYENPALYFEIGKNWLVDSANPPALSHKFMGKVLAEAARGSSLRDMGPQFVEIPLDIVKKEVQERFPGRWDGDFKLNSRGPRFWDPDADASSALVVSGGMVCFTGDKPFMTWAQIFGPRFVEGFLEDKIGGAINDIYFDGKSYWSKNPITELWESYGKEDMGLRLEVNQSLSASAESGCASEVKQAIVQIQNVHRIQGAVPFIYIPKSIIFRNGKRFLNTSTAAVMLPEDGGPYFEDSFPWFANYFNLLLSEEQRIVLLAWLQHFYVNALNGTPRKGHSMFLAGDTNQGKSLFTQLVASIMFGGHVDASSYLKGETTFNKQLFESGLWTIDDTSPASDMKQQAVYSALLKKITADQTFEYMAKYQDATMVEWVGRLIVTCNLDPESIRVIPNLDISNLDKIIALRIATVDPALKNFKPPAELRSILQRELPFFLNFLQHWTRPESLGQDVRYGFKSYIHESIKTVAHESSDLTSFEELLTLFYREYFDMNKKKNEWVGNSTELQVQMLEDDALKNIVTKLSSVQIGRQLNKLQNTGFPVRRKKDGAGRAWIVHRKDFE